MPKVAQFGPSKVTSQVVSQPRAQVGAAAGAFGGAITQGLTELGLAAADVRQRIDVTSSEEALVQFERDKNKLFFNPDNGYFNTQGRNAFDQAQATSAAMEDLRKSHEKNLKSENSKALFNKSAAAHITKGNTDIMRHSSRGARSWELATVQSQVENTIENAALFWGQPETMKVQNALGRRAVVDAAKLEGVGAEATAERLQTFDSSFTRSAITAATASSAAEGQALMTEQGDRLEGPDKLILDKQIAAKAKAEKTQSDAQFAILKAGNLVERHDSRQEIIDEVNKIEDPELRKKTMSEAMSQLSRNKQAESEAQGDSAKAAEDHIVAGGTWQSFAAEDPVGWERLSKAQQAAFKSGKAIVTKWPKFSELMVLPRDQLSKINPADHFQDLATVERSKLISAVKSARGTGSKADRIDHQTGRTRNAQTSSVIEQIFGKKSKWNQSTRDKVNGFYDLVDQEVKFREDQKDASLTSEEFTNLLSGLTREVTIQRSAFGVDRLFPDVERNITDIPAEEVQEVSKFLRDKGIPVTSDNIIKAHQQASQ